MAQCVKVGRVFNARGDMAQIHTRVVHGDKIKDNRGLFHVAAQ